MLNISKHFFGRNVGLLPTDNKHAKSSLQLYEVAWQFNNLAHSSGLMFGRIIFTNAVRSLLTLSVQPLSGIFGKKTPKRTWLCAGISLVRYALQTR